MGAYPLFSNPPFLAMKSVAVRMLPATWQHASLLCRLSSGYEVELGLVERSVLSEPGLAAARGRPLPHVLPSFVFSALANPKRCNLIYSSS